MAEVAVIMVGDAAKLLAENEKLIRKQSQLEDRIKKTEERSKSAAEAAKREAEARAKAADVEKAAKDRAKMASEAKVKMDREEQRVMAQGKALTESLMTPQERFNQKVRESIALKDKGAISAETLKRRYKTLKEELRATEAAQAKANAKFAQGSTSLVDQKGLIGAATTAMGGYVSAAGAAAMAINTIKKGLVELQEQQQKGFDALKQTEDGARALLQISDSPEQFTQLQNQAQQLSSATGVPIERVQAVMFSAVSEGFRDAVPDIIAANQVIAPEAAAGVAGQVPTLFQGAIEPLEAVNLTLKAARDSRLNFEQIARSLPAAVEGAAIAQATPEETLATLSVLAARFKSGETAADRIKGFSTLIGLDQGVAGTTDADFQEAVVREQERAESAARQLRSKEERVTDLEKQYAEAKTISARERIATNLQRAQRDVAEFDRSKLEVQMPERAAARESLAGIGIVKAVERLQAMTQEERTKILGTDQEKNAAFLALSQELGNIKTREQDIIREREAFSQGGGILRDRIATAQTDPELTALREEAIARARLEGANRAQLGVEGAQAQTAGSMRQEALMRQGGVFAPMMGGVAGRTVEAFGAAGGFSPEATAQASVAASSVAAQGLGIGAPVIDSLLSLMRANAQSQREAITAQDRATKAMERAAQAQRDAARPQTVPPRPITDAARNQINQGGG